MSGTLGGHQLRALGAMLSPRDREILRSLEAHRFMSTNQIARLFFARTESGRVAVRACTRVLARLHGLNVVDRLERQVGGHRSGSAAYVWNLTRTGQRIVLAGSDRRYQRTQHLPSLDHLAHVLAIVEVHVLLTELARSGSVELLDVELEPTCWRQYVGPEGIAQTLKPDLSAVTATAEYEDHWFVEVDRGRAGLQVLARKCAQYTAYARTGAEQQRRGTFPYVLWLLPSEARVKRLVRETEAAADVDSTLLRFTTPEHLVEVLMGTAPPDPATTDSAETLSRLLAGGAHELF